MELLIPFVLKSFLIAGVTLGLLHLLRSRSASERSMVAHFGLLALLIMPLGSMFLPQLVVQAPIAEEAPPVTQSASTPAAAPSALPPAEAGSFDLLGLWPLLYGFPAALLLAVTLLAVLRLLALRAKASVMVEPSWLSALAHAQRRMNFKHGTALLTSSELKSPISWGVLRPVILLNDEAIEARHEAEAIIAHELAHVRGLDWAKLLLARIVTAVFWFNPLVWILSREAHQLREETADDAVLAANVASTDYAQLLVGVARHDCKGLLLGAHGVAPGKGSLSRRVRRVLDSGLPRAPVARGFAAGVALGVVATAAPLAALTLTPKAADSRSPYYVSRPEPAKSLPSVVAETVADATTVTSEAVAVRVAAALTGEDAVDTNLQREIQQRVERRLALATPPVAPTPPVPTVPPLPPRGKSFDSALDRAIAAKAMGVTPEYAAQIRAAAPGLRIDDDEIMAFKAIGVTPQWIREMARAGYPTRDPGDLLGARAAGVSPTYVADLAAAGYRNIPLDDLAAMRAIGVTGSYIRGLKAKGMTGLSVERLIELRAHGFAAFAHGTTPPPPPVPPTRKVRIVRPAPEPAHPHEPEEPEPVPDPDGE